jgi:hypothetical protein
VLDYSTVQPLQPSQLLPRINQKVIDTLSGQPYVLTGNIFWFSSRNIRVYDVDKKVQSQVSGKAGSGAHIKASIAENSPK